MYFKTPAWDLQLFEQINMVWRNPALDWIMPVISSHALWVVLLFFFFIYPLYKKGRTRIFLILVLVAVLGFNYFSTDLFKHAVGRMRPLDSIPGTWMHKNENWQQRPAEFKRQKEDGASYPSSHASNAAAAACLIFIFIPGTRKWIWIVPFLIGYSRIYLGKHFPSDIAAGWIFGIWPGLIGAWLYQLFMPRFLKLIPASRTVQNNASRHA
ncbi:MAG: phosphatase PAP2 family protein [Thermodesulfobacteriota bacterium]